MANATARVGRGTVSFNNEIRAHSWGTLSAALQLYAGTMVGLTAGGFLAKFDDTVSLRFFGLILEQDGNPKIPSDGSASATAGAQVLDVNVKQPKRFELNIASVAVTDIGRRVYALDDQTGTLDPSATTYGNHIGTVYDLVYATNGGSPVANYCLVEPIYSLPQGRQNQVLIANGAVQLKDSDVILNKAGVLAATIADPTSGAHDGMKIRIQSVTAFAHTLTAPSGFNASGTVGTWGGAKGDGMEIMAFGGKWYANWLRNVTLS